MTAPSLAAAIREAEGALAHYADCPGEGRWRECSSSLAYVLRSLLAALPAEGEALTGPVEFGECGICRTAPCRCAEAAPQPAPLEWVPMLSLIAWVGRTARATLAEVGE